MQHVKLWISSHRCSISLKHGLRACHIITGPTLNLRPIPLHITVLGPLSDSRSVMDWTTWLSPRLRRHRFTHLWWKCNIDFPLWCYSSNVSYVSFDVTYPTVDVLDDSKLYEWVLWSGYNIWCCWWPIDVGQCHH
jgi:hypothetical protein